MSASRETDNLILETLLEVKGKVEFLVGQAESQRHFCSERGDVCAQKQREQDELIAKHEKVLRTLTRVTDRAIFVPTVIAFAFGLVGGIFALIRGIMEVAKWLYGR